MELFGRNIAYVDEIGYIVPNAPGTVKITAVLDDVSARADFEVTDAALESISIDSETGVFATPVDVSLGLSALGTFSDGTSRDITADAVWTSSDESVGRVENGVFAALRAGETTVTAGLKGSDVTASVKVAISDAAVESLTIGSKTGKFSSPVGVTLNLTVQANFSDGTSLDVTAKDGVAWNSDSTSTLTVEKAAVTPAAVGKANVTAEFEGVSASQEIEITDAVLQSLALEGETSTPMGVDLTLKVMGTYSDGTAREVTDGLYWSSEGDAVVAVGGVVTPLAVGSAKITVTSGEGEAAISAETDIEITAAAVKSLMIGSETGKFKVNVGETLQLTLRVEYTDGKTADVTYKDAVDWKSDSSVIMTVSHGEVSGRKVGTAMAAAELGGVTAEQEIDVLAETQLEALSLEAPDGDCTLHYFGTLQLTAWGEYSDGTVRELTEGLTWESLDPEFATVRDNGLVAANLPRGAAAIRATDDETGSSGESVININRLERIEIRSSTDSFEFDMAYPDRYQYLYVVALYNDDSVVDVSADKNTVIESGDAETFTVNKDLEFNIFEITALAEGKAAARAVYIDQIGGLLFDAEEEITVVNYDI